jgi:hypothetical protein
MRKKIIISVILFIAIGIILAILSYPHLRVIKNSFSHTENIISTTEMKDFALRNGDEKLLINNAIKQNYQIRFNGVIKHLETLYIGKGEKKYNSSYLKLTNDSIFAFIKTDSIRQKLAKKHNLILNNELSIIINKKVDNAEILLTNKIDTFNTSTKFGGMENPFIRSVGSEIKVNDFAFVFNEYKNDVWIFGDSYMNVANPARWPYWIYNDGYKFLCDGMPGGKSIDSYDFLRTALTINKPKYIIWCLGMNDGSDRIFANASWMQYTKKVEELCKENNITLIFGIIPTCPKVFNKHKNNYIRKSGYRYIDFEKALFDSNGNWKEGYCADGVHPTEKGAKVMKNQFLKDFPEIKQYKQITTHNNVYN